jgi:ABC-2 type transport system ATP-binding protein
MRIISGLIYPTTGKVLIDGKELGKDISFPEEMGLLIENPVFLDSYTGADNLRLLASLNGTASNEDIMEALGKVGLDYSDKRKYRKYSLGMKQRLGIAATIMEHPGIIVWDEPLNALDTEGVRLFNEIIKEEKEKGTLIIMSCHDEIRLNEYSTGSSIRFVAPCSFKNSTSRNPHVTDTHSRPEFFAVAISTSESPT